MLIGCSGRGELAENLRLKLVEGLLRPTPPVCDLLDFAHGPYQAAADRNATFLALTVTGTPVMAQEAVICQGR